MCQATLRPFFILLWRGGQAALPEYHRVDGVDGVSRVSGAVALVLILYDEVAELFQLVKHRLDFRGILQERAGSLQLAQGELPHVLSADDFDHAAAERHAGAWADRGALAYCRFMDKAGAIRRKSGMEVKKIVFYGKEKEDEAKKIIKNKFVAILYLICPQFVDIMWISNTAIHSFSSR